MQREQRQLLSLGGWANTRIKKNFNSRDWYGKLNYGYLPSWIGHDQIGRLGNNLSFASSNTREHFFIIEPTYGIPDLWVTYAKGDQESISKLKNQENFGDLTVQERIVNNEK